MLELDHVFCFVPPDGDWAGRIAAAGWSLDAGTSHEGQGTRNRRLVLARQYLELVWVEDGDAARSNPLRLDRRADWARSGASPFGFGFRGLLELEEQPDFWPYDLLGLRIWVRRDDDRAPLVFVLEIDPGERRRPGRAEVPRSDLSAVRQIGPAPAALPAFDGPPIEHTPGDHRLELLIDGGTDVQVTGQLSIVVTAGRDSTG